MPLVDQQVLRPLVSVITPSLNQAEFVTQTIESVLSQNYSPLEYWVIDGGSTDGTLEILHRYRDRLHWISEPDGGQAAAINKGWRLTRGEIIAYLNADDTYLPSAIERVVEYLNTYPQVDAVYGDCDYVDEQGKFLRAYPTRPYHYSEPCMLHSITFPNLLCLFGGARQRRSISTKHFVRDGF